MTDTERVMSGAELKVILTGLGLTPAWLAEHLNITPRTVLRWMDLDVVPARAVAAIETISEITDAEMGKVMLAARMEGVVRTRRTDDEGGVADRNTPLSAAWHRHLTFRALNTLRNKGMPVRVEYAK